MVVYVCDNVIISKVVNFGVSCKKKVSFKKGFYLKMCGNRRDLGGESGGDRGVSGGDGDGRGDMGGGNGECGGDSGVYFLGLGFVCDEGGEDIDVKRIYNLLGFYDKDLFIEVFDSLLEVESVVWKESGCLVKLNGCNCECFFGLVGLFIDILNLRI